ncbi:unnamed protein product [Arabis nemorensis]|uniref:RNase H type-1 domain-containing protein n=1 Tax=Arabis nemorensis TaxID=586526 RepID=A0A565C3A4_9BRAS|nr:unnamed protein product [Arabis nemorensis]
MIFRGIDIEPLETVKRAQEDAEEWYEKMEAKEKGTTSMPGPNVRRKPPKQQWLKCNSDCTWSEQRNTCGTGWILRDQRGEVLWMGAKTLSRLSSVIEAEAEAIRWAIISLKRLGYTQIEFETDSKELAGICSKEKEWPKLGPLMEDIR